MKLVIIFGPQAVGKMTVGHELEKITELKLFHNHMTIELVNPFFSYGTKTGKRLVELFRREIFKEVAKSDMEGLIFTFIWAFNERNDWDYVNKVCDIFESKGGETYFVELEANIEERIKRNTTPHRLEHKPTKRNVDKSENDLKESMNKFRMNSKEGEIKKENYIRIDNTNLNSMEVAEKIKQEFSL
jgi:hypothetical protein